MIMSKSSYNKVTILSEKYGNVSVYLEDNANRYGNGYFVTTSKKGLKLSGFVDLNGKEIIPIDTHQLDEIFSSHNKKDICLAFKNDRDEINTYYHVQLQETGKYEGEYKIVLKTNPNDDVPLRLTASIDEDFWFMEADRDDHIEYALYRPEDKKIITTFFDELMFLEEESPYHYFYFCSDIYSYRPVDNPDGTTEEEKVHFSSLVGFMDREGNFSSQLLDTEKELYYDSYQLGGNSLSNRFHAFLNELQKKYQNEYMEKEDRVDQEISYLFSNCNLSNVPKHYKSKTMGQIIPFNRENK
ncbi:MAG: hypothetical protein E7168_04380 [Firmicutes bacterium]|nr:hypothetical protein [Bacillota bacterium]